MIERSQVEITGPDPDEPQSMEEICRRMAEERLDGLTNARWLPISDADRQQLAEIFARWMAEVDAFVRSVNRRPLIEERAVGLLTNGSDRKRG
jgi:hypothetical protein